MMRFSLPVLLISCLGLFGTSVMVANAAAVNLDLLSAYELSVSNYEDFTIAQQRTIIVDQDKKQAEANFFPTLDLSRRKSKSKSKSNLFSSDIDTDTDVVSLSQSIFNYANIANNRQAAHRQKAENVQYEQTQQRLIFEIAQLYFNVLNAEIELKSNIANLKFVAKNLSVAEKKYQVHEATKADVAEAKSSEQEIRSNIQAARNNLYNQQLLLLNRIGNPEILTLKSKVIISRLHELDVIDDRDYWLELAMKNNKSLQGSKIDEKISQQGIELAKSQFYPTLDFSASRNITKTDGNNPSAFVSVTSNNNNTYSLNLIVPIFAGFRDSAGLTRARLELDNTKLTRNRIQRDIKQQVYSAYTNLVFSKERIEILQTLKDNRKQEVITTQVKLANNDRTYKDILLSEQQFWDSVTAYEQEINRYILNYLTLKQVAGVLSVGDIKTVNGLLGIQKL